MFRSIILFITATLLGPCLWALPTSSFWIPSPETMDASYLRFDIQQEYVLNKKVGQQNHASSFGAALGVYKAETFKTEVSIDYQEPVGSKLSDSIQISGKFQYLHDQQELWKVAAGVRNFSIGADGNFQIFYVVGDIKTFGKDISRVGFYSGSSKLLLNSNSSSSNSGLMLAYYRPLQKDFGSLGVEWVSGKNQYAATTLGAHFRFSEVVDGVIGYSIPNDSEFKHRVILRASLYY